MTTITLVALALAFPYVLLDPGHLLKGHEKLQKDCLSFHTPFRGATSVQCISCHQPENISVKTVAGALLPKENKKVLFHKGLAAESCIECHTDHKGMAAAKAIKSFKHASLETSLRSNCIACHKEQKPADEVHQYAQGSCGECHGTAKWKPSTFDHDRSFRLDRNHQASCKTCHTDPGNYKRYTCYNCHEHSASAMAAVHQEEGISNYQNCMKCHRNGSKEGGDGDD